MSRSGKNYREHAWLYDIAFDWDPSQDIAWLIDRFGGSPRTLLEPGCGSGRLMPGFADRGVAITGIDLSPVMLDRARLRMRAAAHPEPVLHEGEMRSFDLGAKFDGALCPLGTFSYLVADGAAGDHLESVARHLAPGKKYLVQLELRDLDSHGPGEPDEHTRWEVDHPEGRLRTSVQCIAWDRERRVETVETRYEFLDGPRAGEIFADEGEQRVWDWSHWEDLIDRSPFTEITAYDASRVGRYTPLEVGPGLEGRSLTWHELARGE